MLLFRGQRRRRARPQVLLGRDRHLGHLLELELELALLEIGERRQLQRIGVGWQQAGEELLASGFGPADERQTVVQVLHQLRQLEQEALAQLRLALGLNAEHQLLRRVVHALHERRRAGRPGHVNLHLAPHL